MVMSQQLKDQIAWASRIINNFLLGCACLIGMSVYNKVDEMYSAWSSVKNQIENLKESDKQFRADYRDLLVDLKQLQERQYNIHQRINNIEARP